MIPVVIPGATRALGAPADWNPQRDGPCEALPIRDGFHGPMPTMESAWTPDAQELDVLNDGGSIVLRVIGNVHPVVALYVIEAAETFEQLIAIDPPDRPEQFAQNAKNPAAAGSAGEPA